MRKRLTYSNVVSTICLFVVLGGGAYAAGAIHLPKNSVGNKQLKKNAVTGDKVKDGSLSGVDIKVASLGAVPSAQNAESAKNALLLGGQSAAQIGASALAASKVHCPPDMKPVAGACLESTPRTASGLLSAMSNCGADNRRVPSEGEVIAYGRTYGLSGYEWTDVLYTVGVEYKGMIVTADSEGSSVSTSDASTPRAYRCAVAASN